MTTSSRLAVLLALALGASGCVSLEMGRIKREVSADIERSGDATVDRGFAVTFGRGTIGSGRFLTRLVAPAETEPFRRMARNVRQVKVARASIEGSFDARAIRRPSVLDRYEADGWTPVVTVRDSSQAIWMMTREREGGPLTDLLAVVVGDGELVTTRVRGDLTALVLDALLYSQEGDLFGDAFREAGLRTDDEAEGPADPPDSRP